LQYDINLELDATPTREEITRAIKSMAHDKAPGQSKLMTDMIKNPPQEQPISTLKSYKSFGKMKR
jgi:hypothetical protein